MKYLALAGLPLILISGCTSTDPVSLPDVTSLQSPVNAHSGIRHQRPRSLFAGYTKRSIIEPESWKRRNAPPTDWRNQSVDPEQTSSAVQRRKIAESSASSIDTPEKMEPKT